MLIQYKTKQNNIGHEREVEQNFESLLKLTFFQLPSQTHQVPIQSST